MLVDPDAEAIDTPRDAPLGIAVVVAAGLGAGELKGGGERVDDAVVDDGMDGDAIDGAVNVDVVGTLGAGDVMTLGDLGIEDDPLGGPRLLNGRGAGGAGAAGRVKHGA